MSEDEVLGEKRRRWGVRRREKRRGKDEVIRRGEERRGEGRRAQPHSLYTDKCREAEDSGEETRREERRGGEGRGEERGVE